MCSVVEIAWVDHIVNQHGVSSEESARAVRDISLGESPCGLGSVSSPKV